MTQTPLLERFSAPARRQRIRLIADASSHDQPPGITKAGQSFIEQGVRLGVDGLGPFKSAQESAEEALEGRTREQAVKVLIRNRCVVAGSQGFVTGLGGFITLPITIPANIGAGFLIQSHLAAAIAHVYGHNTRSERVQTAILLSLLRNAGTKALKQTGIEAGKKFSITLIKRLPVSVIHAFNKEAGFTLLAKIGTKRAPSRSARASRYSAVPSAAPSMPSAPRPSAPSPATSSSLRSPVPARIFTQGPGRAADLQCNVLVRRPVRVADGSEGL